MRNLNGLGVVETIYEEQNEYFSSISASPDSIISPSPPAGIHSRVQSWTLERGQRTDVLVHVGGICFHLHKDPLSSRSSYLKRQLTERNETTLPLCITVDTFKTVVDFCYGAHIVITPSNVAALRTAAELLGMTEVNGKRDANLKQITESYFLSVIAVNTELVAIVLRSCLNLLPEAETAAHLLSRSVEALNLMGEGGVVDDCLHDVVRLEENEFLMVSECMSSGLPCHDVLYYMVDLYIKEKGNKITEDQRTGICSYIDCGKLSNQVLLHAVQNPRLPLKFIIRAMFTEQLNTRRAMITNIDRQAKSACNIRDSVTLGSILRRDAAAREAVKLKAEMEATYSRIQCLEQEFASMKWLLQKTEEENSPRSDLKEHQIIDSSKSASFHYGFTNVATIKRNERGSTSFASFRVGKKEDRIESDSGTPGFKTCKEKSRAKEGNGKGMMNRLKNMFWSSKSASKGSFEIEGSSKVD